MNELNLQLFLSHDGKLSLGCFARQTELQGSHASLDAMSSTISEDMKNLEVRGSNL